MCCSRWYSKEAQTSGSAQSHCLQLTCCSSLSTWGSSNTFQWPVFTNTSFSPKVHCEQCVQSQTRTKTDIQNEHGYHVEPHHSVGGSSSQRDLKTEQQWQRGCEAEVLSRVTWTVKWRGKQDQLLTVALFHKILFYVTIALTPRSPHTPFQDAISCPPTSDMRLNTRTTTPLTLPPFPLKRHPLFRHNLIETE